MTNGFRSKLATSIAHAVNLGFGTSAVCPLSGVLVWNIKPIDDANFWFDVNYGGSAVSGTTQANILGATCADFWPKFAQRYARARRDETKPQPELHRAPTGRRESCLRVQHATRAQPAADRLCRCA